MIVGAPLGLGTPGGAEKTGVGRVNPNIRQAAAKKQFLGLRPPGKAGGAGKGQACLAPAPDFSGP